MVKDTEDWMMACVKCGDPDEVPEKKSTFAASPWYVRQVETRCKVLYLVDRIQTLALVVIFAMLLS